MTIARFNEIRNAFEAARTVEQINALAVIIRNLAKDRRDQIRRQANA